MAEPGRQIVPAGGARASLICLPGSGRAYHRHRRPGRRTGVSYVAEHPLRRGRGILRALMRRQLDDLHARAVPVAGLEAPRPTDLRLDAAVLGSLFPGGSSIARLARAGRIEADRTAVRRAERMSGSGLDPWCSTEF